VTAVDLSDILVGASPAMQRVRSQVERFAPLDIPVLVSGPTGSGKELVGAALHRLSGRAGRYVPFNVCAISDTMFEDALYGHVRGAFTGAACETRGYLAEADNWTLCLDEISGLSLGLQAKLLRAIETKSYRQLGASADRRSNFRVVSATNEELSDLVRRGQFREDLAHRLAGYVIRMPALHERRSDIPLLARHFVAAGGKPHVAIASCALAVLDAHDWPGNVRQLKHVVECSVALAGNGTLSSTDVLEVMTAGLHQNAAAPPTEFRSKVERALDDANWDTQVAAKALGVHRATLYRWLRRLSIHARSGLRLQ
jgi:two-component system, NtrC family, response regulator